MRIVSLNLLVRKRVEYPDSEFREVLHVSGDDDRAVDARGGGDHGIRAQIVGRTAHQSRPFAIDHPVRRKDCVVAHHPIQPAFKFPRFGRILFSGDLNASLYFAYNDGGNGKLIGGNRLPPRNDGAMRTALSEL